ncbi:MAG: hydrogenase expression/formation protein HypE [Ruminococcus sp.]|jgi:hydrogenase expression/formation protein HypE|nr:hydrogenase expression/formation protein HypE [Ruminococcus sp.]
MKKITLSHGSGGVESNRLIKDIFIKHFGNELEDSAVLDFDFGNAYAFLNEEKNLTADTAANSDLHLNEKNRCKLAFTTDSFVVEPLFFAGGNIGNLAICGTVNDLCAVGAIPLYLSCGFIISEGIDFALLEKIAISMADTAKEANVKIVCGDTKVVPRGIAGDRVQGAGDRVQGAGEIPSATSVNTNELFINTSGIGKIVLPNVSIKNARLGDKIILTGNLGDHHACIMSARMGIANNIKSDVAPLHEIVNLLYEHMSKKFDLQNTLHTELQNEFQHTSHTGIHAMRDVTRGGLVTVLSELCEMSGVGVNLYEERLPVSEEVRGLCGILGLDPLYMGNEGKMFISVSEDIADEILSVIRKAECCKNACIIGEVNDTGTLTLTTKLGVKRMLQPLYGEGLPRIC